MAECLLELRSEEIPARMQVRAGKDLEKLMTKGLANAGLEVSDVTVFTGPRRLVFAATLPARSPDVREERKGPRVGSPEQALAGFMKGAGLTDISQAEVREDKKGEHYVAIIERAGRDAADVLAELIPSVLRDFPWPKSMRSGESAFRWVRPLRGIVAVLDGEVIPFDIGGITSGKSTEGHRQHGPGPYTVTGLEDYVSQLEGPGHVILDHAKRRDLITQQALGACGELTWVEDEGLLNEVAGLVEWPVVLLGDMDPAFLELPEDVIRLTLKSHQKTFTVRGPDGALAPHFIIVANNDAPDGGATIKAGNAKVIGARLADAAFFIETDAKKPLAEHAKGLERVVFHDKLGSYADKVERVAALAREIAPHVGADPDLAEQAARLAKADLVTGTVIEMTSLQGQIGRMMAEREGIDPQVAAAIEDHYKPQGPSDAVPTAPVSVAVALADKLDSLVGFWAIDEKPTGSKDPYALRRSALGIVRTLLENKNTLHLAPVIFVPGLSAVTVGLAIRNEKPLAELLNEALATKLIDYKYASEVAEEHMVAVQQELTSSSAKERITAIANNIIFFLHDRLRGILRDSGNRHDVIDAVLAQGGDDLLAISQRVEALGELLGTPDGENLVAGYTRAANILRAERKKGELALLRVTDSQVPARDAGPPSDEQTMEVPLLHNATQVREPVKGNVFGEDDFTAPEAKALFAALTASAPRIDSALASNDYPAALSTLATLRAPVDAFFDGVMVNSDEPQERIRRLSLLQALVDTAHRIADFSKLDG